MRPTIWTPVGLSSDPVRGDPAAVRARAGWRRSGWRSGAARSTTTARTSGTPSGSAPRGRPGEPTPCSRGALTTAGIGPALLAAATTSSVVLRWHTASRGHCSPARHRAVAARRRRAPGVTCRLTRAGTRWAETVVRSARRTTRQGSGHAAHQRQGDREGLHRRAEDPYPPHGRDGVHRAGRPCEA